MDFITQISELITHTLKLGSTADAKKLSGLRVIKSEFIYAKEKNKDLSEIDIIKKLYNSRKETAEIYKNVNQEAWLQEIIEQTILEQFLPKAISLEETISFFKDCNIDKDKKNFKLFQSAFKEKYDQSVDSTIVLNFITGKYD